MRRFYYNSPLAIRDIITLDGENSKHITTVLRMEIGNDIEIIANALSYHATITELSRDGVLVCINHQITQNYESNIRIHLLQGMPKGEKLELILQKSTELGVHSFTIVPMARSIAQIKGDKAGKKLERYTKIIENAGKQCGRQLIPNIDIAPNLSTALANLPKDCQIFVAWEEENKLGFKEILRSCVAEDIAIIVGPEGGIETREIEEILAFGGKSISLGKRILRTETAGLALVSIIQYELGDLGGKALDK